MSLISAPYPFTYKRQPAEMHVIKNDGFCWGIFVLKDGTNLEVSTARDYYDSDEERAVDAFINAAKRGKATEPVVSWTLGFSGTADER